MALGTYEMALHLSQMLVQYATSFSERGFLPLLAGRRDRIDVLIEKEKLNPLTDEDKSELRQIL
jgi:hypothetical protein